jgi:ferredoxin
MTPFGRDLCPTCRGDILRLPTDTGPQTFDAAEFPVEQVDGRDRYLVLPHAHASKIDPARPAPSTCLRVHHCRETIGDEAVPAARPANEPPSRADYTALHRITTLISLYRSQQTGTLRRHPGQRTYEPVSVSARLVALGRLNAEQCALCKRPLTDSPDTLAVGASNSDPPYTLKTCAPVCPEPRSETASESALAAEAASMVREPPTSGQRPAQAP